MPVVLISLYVDAAASVHIGGGQHNLAIRPQLRGGIGEEIWVALQHCQDNLTVMSCVACRWSKIEEQFFGGPLEVPCVVRHCSKDDAFIRAQRIRGVPERIALTRESQVIVWVMCPLLGVW